MSKKQWLTFGLRFVPYVGGIIQGVQQIKSAKGEEKLAAVQTMIDLGIEATEFAADKDLLKNEKVREAQIAFINAYVGFQNALAEAKAGAAAIGDVRADGTGTP
ncbi:MAG: hypothetical protein OEW98_00265 [Betaproteobacteria bacterium]|nr:hypothetical protein [Betaproteobacteria bacterium]